MYSTRPGLVLGFHGCDKSVAHDVVNGKTELKFSENTFDWLGHGAYFWEYSADRAFDYAKEASLRKKAKSEIKEPAILGAVIDLGFCLDLIEFKNLALLRNSFEQFKGTCNSSGIEIPQNKNAGDSDDFLLRDLDCAIIEFLHQFRIQMGLRPFDSVKGVFLEGKELYPQAGFKEKNHIQICVRNPNCIKGFFLPRKSNDAYPSI